MSKDSERRVIINGDDFGLSRENNAGIIAAHRHGVLSSASLMVSGDSAQEAADLARRHPVLAVGLHVTFSDTKPVLPPDQVSMLVMPNGRFPPDDGAHRAALSSAEGRRQIRTEIAAQFREFRALGLVCDHVNAHRHAHRRPLLAWMIFREASRWQVNATRIPWDPPTDPLRYLRAVLLRRLGKIYGLNAPDRCIDRNWNIQRLPDFLANLPAGSTEIFFHPVEANNHRFAADLPILLDERVKAALAGLTLCGLRYATTGT
jgi:chitin disaccharide deacetylase